MKKIIIFLILVVFNVSICSARTVSSKAFVGSGAVYNNIGNGRGFDTTGSTARNFDTVASGRSYSTTSGGRTFDSIGGGRTYNTISGGNTYDNIGSGRNYNTTANGGPYDNTVSGRGYITIGSGGRTYDNIGGGKVYETTASGYGYNATGGGYNDKVQYDIFDIYRGQYGIVGGVTEAQPL